MEQYLNTTVVSRLRYLLDWSCTCSRKHRIRITVSGYRMRDLVLELIMALEL